ncbi:hypothetical protein KL951_001444 [Ogataea haglerorum]|nr:hypothetical protein KL951_001444 [Ogataea haglerorum]
MAIGRPPSYEEPGIEFLVDHIPKNSNLKVSNGAIVLRHDMTNLGTLYLEAPYFLIPPFDLVKLVEVGKCCSYCGETLKIYDKGRLRDKEAHDVSDQKHMRFMSGLDCGDCSSRWCSQNCRKLDFCHSFLNHQPTNKGMTNQITNSRGEKLVLLYDRWVSFKKAIHEKSLELAHCGLYVTLQLFYYPELREGYMSMRNVVAEQRDEFLGREIDFTTLYEEMTACFKDFKLSEDEFLDCLSIFKLNNYNSGVYPLTSYLSDPSGEINCSISPFETSIAHDYEDFRIDVVDEHNVTLTKQRHLESYRKPIHTSTLKIDKKIIIVSSMRNIKSCEKLVAGESHETGSACSSSDNSSMEKITAPIPHRFPGKARNQRNASFTSSGNSFGEGIIKYNRDQIREMLVEMSLDSDDSEAETPIQLEVPEQFVKPRRKSVRFELNESSVQV